MRMKKRYQAKFLILALIPLFLSCDQRKSNEHLFSEVTMESNVQFENNLTYTETLNPYTYRNFYNGAGVAVGDINNDGLPDIYFAGNQVDNKLYLNEGDFQFRDITTEAGVACKEVWSTGVTMVDINADGWLDIYVCKSGDPNTPRRYNELFINNGDLTFTEKSKEYGLDIKGLSVHAAFFDYDKDGDLDCYLLTNSIRSVGNYDLIKGQREIPDPSGGGNKFFINENGFFKDATSEAEIYHSNIGFGLGITLGDFNRDDWTDIFISNDFFERDYLYINNKKGGFDERLTDYFKSISMGSMGADVADLDNDGGLELLVTEMLPDSLNRKKHKTVYENWNKYQLNIESGYHHQFPRNTLQKNIGDSSYVEVGRMLGIDATEWSWGALMFDMDNSGFKDVFIANGIYKDLLDRDYLNYTATDENIRQMIRDKEDVIKNLVDNMPSQSVHNYAFKNEGDLSFKEMTEEWGLGAKTFSNGSAYGDLDNDGDLDLVVNNINMPSLIYRNNTDTAQNRSITIQLRSKTNNTYALGTSIEIYYNGRKQMADNFVTRGFQSTVDPRVHFGVENTGVIDSLIVNWFDGSRETHYNIATNQLLEIEHVAIDDIKSKEAISSKPILVKLSNDSKIKYNPSGLNDFNRNGLLPKMYSTESPSLTKTDVDGDGNDEIYFSGGKDQPGSFLSISDDHFMVNSSAFMSKPEETRSIFLDIDNDGDQDFYLASGGRFYSSSSSVLKDRIYLNDGNGNFTLSEQDLPFLKYLSTSAVVPFDLDNDNDLDLFVAERFHPFYYGTGGRGYLLENQGDGSFKDVTDQKAAELTKENMITDALSVDIDGNGWQDLVVVGDWMPITILINNSGKLETRSKYDLPKTNGWWMDIESADLNNDGLPDFVVGNHGLNTTFKAGDRLYINDFDNNGAIEQIYCTRINDQYYPILDKDELISQIPVLKKKVVYYRDYAGMSIEELFTPGIIEQSKILEVDILASVALLSTPEGYEIIRLPQEAQYAPIHSLLILDVNKDGIQDLFAGGNEFQVKPQFGRFDASKGWLFPGKMAEGSYTFDKAVNLKIDGQIRDFEILIKENKQYLIVAKYDDELEVYKIVGF
jgi:hypothetical protein